MRAVAIIAFRNEERVLDRTLKHLAAQGLEVCLIDNGSTDRSAEIARSFLGRGVFRLESAPFVEGFNMPGLMGAKEALAREIDADWFLHQDADEIREAPAPYRTLRDGFIEADRQDYNAINFNEFVFLPASPCENFEGTDYVDAMRRYYFFRPRPLRRINAWANTGQSIDLHTLWGHQVIFDGRRVFPEPFILRHYIALSRAHALAKYCGRVHAAPDLKLRGWKNARVAFRPEKLNFPAPETLKTLGDDGAWDTSDPWLSHTFLGQKPSDRPENAPPASSSTPKAASVLTKPSASAIGKKHLPMPIVVGVARSGTTLMRMMLDSHPLLAIPPETHFLPALREIQERSKLSTETNEDSDREAFLRVITESLNWPEFGLAEETLRAEISRSVSFTVPSATRRFYRLYAALHGKPRWGDKTPPYVWHLIEICKLLPEARFIHLIRDGRDVAVSNRGLWFNQKGDIEEQAAHWVWRIREAKQQASFCPHYLEVRFEHLVAEPASTMQSVCDFLELEFSPQMLDYHKTAGRRLELEFTDRIAKDGSVILPKARRHAAFSKVCSPPDTARIGRWRDEMTRDELTRYLSVAETFLRELGYPVS